MIKFFRNIRQNLIMENKTSKYLKYAVGEIVLVVIGILIALQINNWNEQKNEEKNANVLAQSMLDDLVKDTIALRSAIDFNNKKLEIINNFISILHTQRETWDETEFYKHMYKVFETFPFSQTDGTYSQMKSSGTLRFFNQDLVNKMNAFDNQLKKTLYRDELIEKAEWELVPFASTILNFEVTGELRFNKPITHETYIKIDDQNTKDIFINKVLTVKIMMGRTLQEYEVQLKLGIDLINELRNSYSLK